MGITKNIDKVDVIIGETGFITGEVAVKGSLHVVGKIDGNITADGNVLVGEKGDIKGDIKAGVIEIAGQVKGNIYASKKTVLLKSANLIGDIQTESIKIDEGAKFRGTCVMGKIDDKKGKK